MSQPVSYELEKTNKRTIATAPSTGQRQQHMYFAVHCGNKLLYSKQQIVRPEYEKWLCFKVMAASDRKSIKTNDIF